MWFAWWLQEQYNLSISGHIENSYMDIMIGNCTHCVKQEKIGNSSTTGTTTEHWPYLATGCSLTISFTTSLLRIPLRDWNATCGDFSVISLTVIKRRWICRRLKSTLWPHRFHHVFHSIQSKSLPFRWWQRHTLTTMVSELNCLLHLF